MNINSNMGPGKFTRGHSYFYEGKEVFVYTSNRGDGKIAVCEDKLFKSAEILLARPDELQPYEKPKAGIVSKIKKLTVDKLNEKADLNLFFDAMAERMPFHCQCCGKPLYASTKFFKRCVTAHILPKAEFKSIATNPDNIFFLGWGIIGVCFCHDDWDRKGAENRTRMNVYPLALERFELLKPCLTDHELVKAHEYLSINFNQCNYEQSNK